MTWTLEPFPTPLKLIFVILRVTADSDNICKFVCEFIVIAAVNNSGVRIVLPFVIRYIIFRDSFFFEEVFYHINHCSERFAGIGITRDCCRQRIIIG